MLRNIGDAFPQALSESEIQPFEPLEAYASDARTLARPRGLPLLDMRHWTGDPPPRRSIWGAFVPFLQTTMLTGSGGIGKSLFEQALVTHIALGRPFLGLEVEQRNALYVTCEDDPDELWRRQAAICAAMGVSIDQTLGKLHLSSLVGEHDTALATFDKSGRIRPTDRWAQLAETCDDRGIGLYAFDNATDAMAGDLSDIHQVAEFVNLLTGLAIRCDGAAMIIHHPNKAGEDWLGSVAWHNKVRSRLIIEFGDDGDPDGRVIRNPKANYGPSGGKLGFRWHRGAFVRIEDLPANYAAEVSESILTTGENEAFLRCLRAREQQGEGRQVGPAPGPNYAPTQFEGMREAKGHKRIALKRAMDRLFAIGSIESYTYRNTAKGRDVTVIREVPDAIPNPSPNSSRTRFPSTLEQSIPTPPNHPRTHSPLKGGSEGPSEGPSPSPQEPA